LKLEKYGVGWIPLTWETVLWSALVDMQTNFVLITCAVVLVNLNGTRVLNIDFAPDEVNFQIYLIFPVSQGPGVYSISNANEYQKHKNNNVSGE
jgi:hypothetical protein